MNCDQGSRIIIVPAGCLGHREIDLQCKSPLESVYYQFSMVNRLSPSDAISCVSAQPSDETLSVDRITVSGQTFRARISGGTMNTKTGIRFLVTTRANEEREFVVTLPIMPEGIMGSGEAGNYVLGDTGPQGPQGCAATVTVGKVLPTEPDGDPKIVNSGTEVDAVLDFTLPRGQVGPQGERGQAATVKIGNVVTGAAGSDAAVENRGDEHNAVLDFTIPEGRQGIQGIQGKAGTQILLSNRDPVARDAKENIVWLNDVTGDLFETVSRGGDAYSWHKSGNLKGEAGSIIYTGTVDPVYNEVYKKSDLYFNITNSNLFTFNDNQWVRLANLKGDQGERGSLWFFAQEDPVTSSSYRVGDSFLNTASNDLFVFNGTNWQKVGNLQGKQGGIGPQGLQGDTGPQGLQGIQGEKGEAGKDGRDGFDGTRIITSQQDPDQGSAPLNPNVVWINTTSWEVKRTIPHGDSWDWVSLGSIRGPRGGIGPQGLQGDTGPQGLQGIQGEKGEAGKDGRDGFDGTRIITSQQDPDQGSAPLNPNVVWINTTSWEVKRTIPHGDSWDWVSLGSIRGPRGDTGPQGLQGLQGEKGAKGDDGSRWYSGHNLPDATIGLNDPRGMPRAGDQYLYLDEKTGEASAYIYTNDKTWGGPLGKVAGPQGKAATVRAVEQVRPLRPDEAATIKNIGDEHDAILQFSIPKGEKGDVGPIGKEGAAATIRIGTVTTTDPDVQASVRNSGSENTAVLEFSIPKGEKGDSYTNDGSTELNVKSIQSDGGKVGTDGAGKLSAEMLDYTIKVPTPSHQDASLGKVVDKVLNNVSFSTFTNIYQEKKENNDLDVKCVAIGSDREKAIDNWTPLFDKNSRIDGNGIKCFDKETGEWVVPEDGILDINYDIAFGDISGKKYVPIVEAETFFNIDMVINNELNKVNEIIEVVDQQEITSYIKPLKENLDLVSEETKDNQIKVDNKTDLKSFFLKREYPIIDSGNWKTVKIKQGINKGKIAWFDTISNKYLKKAINNDYVFTEEIVEAYAGPVILIDVDVTISSGTEVSGISLLTNVNNERQEPYVLVIEENAKISYSNIFYRNVISRGKSYHNTYSSSMVELYNNAISLKDTLIVVGEVKAKFCSTSKTCTSTKDYSSGDNSFWFGTDGYPIGLKGYNNAEFICPIVPLLSEGSPVSHPSYWLFEDKSKCLYNNAMDTGEIISWVKEHSKQRFISNKTLMYLGDSTNNNLVIDVEEVKDSSENIVLDKEGYPVLVNVYRVDNGDEIYRGNEPLNLVNWNEIRLKNGAVLDNIIIFRTYQYGTGLYLEKNCVIKNSEIYGYTLIDSTTSRSSNNYYISSGEVSYDIKSISENDCFYDINETKFPISLFDRDIIYYDSNVKKITEGKSDNSKIFYITIGGSRKSVAELALRGGKLINPSISFFYQGSINVIDEMINFKEIVVEPEPVIVTNNIKGQLKRIVKKGDRIKLLGYWSSQIQEFSSFPLGLNKVRTTLNLI
ncbi:phage fiber-tail adaptor protein [Commensalibacter melissae]|uniref:phage fiber-tail adaptor protein n=2 Tax=Commensalibacter TaxID=1079922 RepID=UPI000EFBE9D0|nr:collagen-like protein [Commensalibacter melissae]AYN86425.1 collagen-like protein [Commensalibacter melissae]